MLTGEVVRVRGQKRRMNPQAQQRSTHVHSARTHNLRLQYSYQLKFPPALHRISHRFFLCISQIIAPKVELGQDRVDLQRLRDRLGNLIPDVVASEVEGAIAIAEVTQRR